MTVAIILASVAGVSCDDDADSRRPDLGGITFTDPVGRTPVNTGNIREFRVWALTDPGGRKVLDGVVVRRFGANSWRYSPVTAWPDSKVDFYAVTPAGVTADINPPYSHWVDFTTDDGLTDLAVAVKMGARQQDGRIRLNFCHTLARLVVDVSTPLADTGVRMKGIVAAGVSRSGRYTIPFSTTVKDMPSDAVTRAWQVWSPNTSSFFIYNAGDGWTDICAAPYAPDGGAEFFIPVEFAPFSVDGGYVSGSYMGVVYQLYDKSSGRTLWPDGTTDRFLQSSAFPGWGVAYFPLSDSTPGGRWYAGREYHYSISINGEASLPGTRSAMSNAVSVSCRQR